ncbi:hypothetical protein [Nocardia beijingensis]|uniref:hypothetical protein n=1 Tax=Nocardia beijingensis TaxID=95162 RepID=UPI0033B08344
MVNQQVVKYAKYRSYQAIRIKTSNAMMGLLSGAGLAGHFLQITEGSNSLLPDVFPNVPHIHRFNLSTSSARQILNSADTYLGAMAVPYILALHEDYLKSCLELLEVANLCNSGAASNSRLATQHDLITTATGGNFSSIARVQIDTLRRMRNCTIHSGGKVDGVLINDLSNWNPAVEQAWEKVAKRSPRNLAAGQTVTFGYGEMLLALAVTKTLERETNVMLQGALPRNMWADMVIQEMLENDPNAIKTTAGIRTAKGTARQYYGPLSLTESEIEDAIKRVI